MKLRIPTLVAALALFGWGTPGVARAQPAVPSRPGFNPMIGFFGGGPGGISYYGGMMRPQLQMAQMQNQMNQANMNLANLQSQVIGITNAVNPNLPRTGRGAVYNSLGHWYPTSRYGGGGGMGGGGYGMISTSSPVIQSGGMSSGGMGAVRR